MCPPKAPKVQAPAASAAPAAAGADSLKIGGEESMSRTRGAIGRLKLRTAAPMMKK
jgi:uncharacterized protein YfiM (DUF2279 family)